MAQNRDREFDDALEKQIIDFARISIYGPPEFLEKLGTPEEVAARTASYSLGNAREFLVTRCLIALQTTAFCWGRWITYVKEYREAVKTVKTPSPALKMQLSWIITEQAVWVRRLSEVLITLICYQKSNEDIYFYHRLLVEDLDRALYRAFEQREFFGLENSKILQHDITMLHQRIRDAEKQAGFDPDKCWYLHQVIRLGDKPVERLKPGVMSSILKQARLALSCGTDTERRTLGYSYGVGISEPSELLHFTPLPTVEHDTNQFIFGAARLGLLSCAILARAQEVLRLYPDTPITRSALEWLRQGDGGKSPFSGVGDKGDFVVFFSHEKEPFLAEITDIADSLYGNSSYKIKFLAEKPLPNLDEDWVMANRFSLFRRKAELVNDTLDVMKDIKDKIDPKEWELLASQDALDFACRKSIQEVWELAGFRERIIRDNADPPKK